MQNLVSNDPDYRLWTLLNRVRDAIYKAREYELGPLGISPVQAAVLFVVQALGRPATPAEISRLLLRETNSVSGLLNRMEKEGLLRKTEDPERKNLVRITVTEKGQKAYYASSKRESIHGIFSSLSEEQWEQQTACLDELLARALDELRARRRLPFE